MISGHVLVQSAHARCSQMHFEASLAGWILEVKMDQNCSKNWTKNEAGIRVCFGSGNTERAVDMVVQGSSKSKIIILFNYI